jgi:predicted transcriptional regulator
MQITQKHIEAAKLEIEGKLTQAEIAQQVGITERAFHYWLKNPEFQKLMQTLADEYKEKAKKLMRRWAGEAAKKLLLLVTKSLDDEVARKAANDILKGAGITIEENDRPSGNNQILIIRSNGDEGKVKDSTEVLSGRFRL